MTHPKRQLSFPYNRNKATQAVLWLLHRHGGAINKLKLVKLVFYADRKHLAQYGRPIVGGPYVAMEHGPVSSELLDYINMAIPEAGFPFTLEGYQVCAKGPVDEDELSESDIKVLEDVDAEYGRYDRFSLRDLTHHLQAWKKNYPSPRANTSCPLPYEDFFLDLKDDEMLKIVREHQEAMDFSS